MNWGMDDMVNLENSKLCVYIKTGRIFQAVMNGGIGGWSVRLVDSNRDIWQLIGDREFKSNFVPYRGGGAYAR